MNSRERVLAILLLGIVVLGGGGFFGYQFVYLPYSTRSKQLDKLQEEVKNKTAYLAKIEQKRSELTRYQQLSLPGDEEVAQREYEKYLTRLLDRHNIKTNRSVIPQKSDTNKTAPTTADKVPIYKRLSFTIQALATTDNIVAMLKEFYSTGLLQEVRSLKITRQLTTANPGGGQTRADELDLNMTVEALIVTGTDKRPYLLPNYSQGLLAIDVVSGAFGGGASTALFVWPSLSPGRLPTGLLAEPERDYTAINRKNIFLGKPPKKKDEAPADEKAPEWLAARYSHLNAITPSTFRTSAEIFDVSTNTTHRLREPSPFNVFPIVRDGESGLRIIVGVVVKIDDRDVFYRTDIDVPETAGERTPIVKLTKSERDELLSQGAPAAVGGEGVLRVERAFWEKMLRQKIVAKKDGHFAVEMTREREPVVASGRQPAAAPGGRGNFPFGAGRGAGRGTAPAAPGGAAPTFPGGAGDFGDPGAFGGFGGFGPPAPFELLRITVLFDENPDYVYIRPLDRYYVLHIGESIEDSLKKPLSPEKVKELAAK